MVKTSLLTPLPVVSPPRSIMCGLTPAAMSRPSTPSPSRALRNMRSSFGVITTSPGCRAARRAAPWGRSAEGLGSRDAALQEHSLDGETVHLGVAGNRPLLHLQALALFGLLQGADAAVAVDAAGEGRGGGLAGGDLTRGRRVQVVGSLSPQALGVCRRGRRQGQGDCRRIVYALNLNVLLGFGMLQDQASGKSNAMLLGRGFRVFGLSLEGLPKSDSRSPSRS